MFFGKECHPRVIKYAIALHSLELCICFISLFMCIISILGFLLQVNRVKKSSEISNINVNDECSCMFNVLKKIKKKSCLDVILEVLGNIC